LWSLDSSPPQKTAISPFGRYYKTLGDASDNKKCLCAIDLNMLTVQDPVGKDFTLLLKDHEVRNDDEEDV
jgi:hypothetical protein